MQLIYEHLVRFETIFIQPPPNAPIPGDDADYPDDWRDVIATVLTRLNKRIEFFWDR